MVAAETMLASARAALNYCTEFAANSRAGSTTADATGGSTTAIAAFSKSGTGDAVFDILAGVKKIHIQGASTGTDTDFVVRIDGVLVVSAAIGPAKVPSSYDGVQVLFSGGTVQITQSSGGVSWKFTEIP